MYSKLLKGVCDPRNFNRALLQIQLHSAHSSKFSTLPKRDPFGIEGEQGLEDIVQGIYTKPPVQKPKSESARNNTEATSSVDSQTAGPAADTEADPDAKYHHWRRSRAQKIKDEDITAEQVYESNFGEIRFDKENRVRHHGQFDEEFFNEDEAFNTVSEKSFNRLARQSKAIGNQEKEPALTTIGKTQGSIRPNNVITEPDQAEELKKLVKVARNMKSAIKQVVQEKMLSEVEPPEGEIREEKVVKKTPKVEVSEPPKPKTVHEYLKLKRMTETVKNEDLNVKIGGKEFKIPKTEEVKEEIVRHVPTIYEKPNYNQYTHGELFSLLKKHVCFQNEFLLAINKPFGLPMHTGTNECRHTVIDFLEDFAKYCNVKQIFPCHRLDKDTTGVLLLAKSEDAAMAIKMKFANRTILKQYFAIVKNCPAVLEGTIKIPIGEGKVPNADVFRAVLKPDLSKYNITVMQKNCKEAITRFKVLKSHEHCAFLEVYPETGLTHQIRVHLAHGLGTPILGDHKYSHRDKMAPQRLHEDILQKLKVKQSKVRLLPFHLHCSKIEFTMPDGFMSKNWHEPVFIHARPSNFFLHTLRVLGLKNRR